ncbi:MAG: lytic transglycosylase domain-containing protein [Candidatus Korobacteraceae bacterium]
MWTVRTSARRLFTSTVLAWVVLALASSLSAQSPQPTSENGRIVWTNDAPERLTSHQPQLAYWSNVEQRWIPLRAATPRAMRSARAVAGQVSSYIESHPALDSGRAKVKGKLAAQNPNDSAAARNRSVSAAKIDRFIEEAAARHHVDPNLVRALVQVESNFNPGAVSSKGAMGLMQLMPETARKYDVSNPFDAAQNVEAGVRHLKGLLENNKGNVSLSLAAYNAGQAAVERNGGIPPYTETRNYVKRITNIMGSGPDLADHRLAFPIEVHRDDRGRLVITNTD